MQCGSQGFCIQMQSPGLLGYLILSILKAELKTRTWCEQEVGKVTRGRRMLPKVSEGFTAGGNWDALLLGLSEEPRASTLEVMSQRQKLVHLFTAC